MLAVCLALVVCTRSRALPQDRERTVKILLFSTPEPPARQRKAPRRLCAFLRRLLYPTLSSTLSSPGLCTQWVAESGRQKCQHAEGGMVPTAAAVNSSHSVSMTRTDAVACIIFCLGNILFACRNHVLFPITDVKDCFFLIMLQALWEFKSRKYVRNNLQIVAICGHGVTANIERGKKKTH